LALVNIGKLGDILLYEEVHIWVEYVFSLVFFLEILRHISFTGWTF